MFSSRIAAADEPGVAAARAAGDESFEVLLQPLSHPELAEIRMADGLFAIGRTEPPFDSYAPELVADMSRRHARIFAERGAVYLADLGSKNGTSVNGEDIRQKTRVLHDGDEVCFGGVLSYRVRLGAGAEGCARGERLAGVILTPERDDLELQPIVVTQFPFLVSKADAAFARYKDEYAHQVEYLSRRHAHVFLKGGAPFIEDLGSTNGTFLNGTRLDEHAVALKEGDLLAFGGHHFVYRLSLHKEEAAAADPTLTKFSPARVFPGKEFDADKTTFVVAADSFLDIFCVDTAASQEDKPNDAATKAREDGGKETDSSPRSGSGVFVSALKQAFWGNERIRTGRALLWGGGALALAAVLAFAFYQRGGPQREAKDLLARGEYAAAAALADRQLEREPDNAPLRTLGSEALLRARVPEWLGQLRAGEFDRANATLAAMKQHGRHNPDVQPLLEELEWMGALERFVMGRGGVEAPIRLYADEDAIKGLLKRWEADKPQHQRAFATISSWVPQFKDAYAEALSHLRKLESDESVYLPAMERLKAGIATELDRDQPGAIEALLQEYSEKYPRLGGLDRVREDLRRYLRLLDALRTRDLAALVALVQKIRFSTPSFQSRFAALKTSGAFPPPDVMQQYEAVSRAWRAGDAKQAFTGLQRMNAGPWADAASRQLERKQMLTERFAELQKARGSKDYDQRLVAFYGALDPEEDAYFVRAIEADVGAYKDQALRRAQGLLNQAQADWRKYRANGGIEGKQRLEAGLSNEFSRQARLLADAQDHAQQGLSIYSRLKMDRPAEWGRLQDEIRTEAQLQRRSLMELRNVLEPRLLKAKLKLLGVENDDGRQPSQAAG